MISIIICQDILENQSNLNVITLSNDEGKGSNRAQIDTNVSEI